MIYADDIHVGVSRIEGTARAQVIGINAGRGKVPRLEIEDIVEPPSVTEIVDHVRPDPAIVRSGHVRATPHHQPAFLPTIGRQRTTTPLSRSSRKPAAAS